MNKLIAVIVAAMFGLSSVYALAADEMKKGDMDKGSTAEMKKDTKADKEAKAAKKKADKEAKEAKKDEMKK